MRERILAVLLALGAGVVVIGVATWSEGLALVVAGVAVGAWAWLFFGDVE